MSRWNYDEYGISNMDTNHVPIENEWSKKIYKNMDTHHVSYNQIIVPISWNLGNRWRNTPEKSSNHQGQHSGHIGFSQLGDSIYNNKWKWLSMTFTALSDNNNIIDCNKWRTILYKYQSPNPLTHSSPSPGKFLLVFCQDGLGLFDRRFGPSWSSPSHSLSLSVRDFDKVVECVGGMCRNTSVPKKKFFHFFYPKSLP